jgi:hypothetical protein
MIILRRIIYGLLSIVVLVIVLILLWAVIQHLRDPLDFIDRPIANLQVTQDSIFQADFLPFSRNYHSITLTDPDISNIICVISFPPDIPAEGLPVVIILGGLEIGHYTLRYIPEPGNNIIIVYQYPYHPEYWYAGLAMNEIPAIRESILSIPSQVVAVRNWVASQEWSDDERITITGYSFGAFCIPAIYRLAEKHRVRINYGVITYGGADLYRILEANMTNVLQPWRSIVSWLAITAIRGMEPTLHTSFLRSEFLLINGTRDYQIPENSWRELHRMIREPKTIRILNEGHMHPRNTDLTKLLVRISQEWLLQKEAINP